MISGTILRSYEELKFLKVSECIFIITINKLSAPEIWMQYSGKQSWKRSTPGCCQNMSITELSVWLSCLREVENQKCHQIVTKPGAKRAKTKQIQKTEIVAILRLAKGFSWIFYEIAKRRFYFSRPPHSSDLPLLHKCSVITKLKPVPNQCWSYYVRNQSAKNTYPPASSVDTASHHCVRPWLVPREVRGDCLCRSAERAQQI